MAWNETEQKLLFLEFTRSMDQGDSLEANTLCKGKQYNAAVCVNDVEIQDITIIRVLVK